MILFLVFFINRRVASSSVASLLFFFIGILRLFNTVAVVITGIIVCIID